MSGAEVLTETKLIPLEDNDKDKEEEEENEQSIVVYCNDFNVTDDEVDSDGSYDNDVEEGRGVKPFVQCHKKVLGLSSKGAENFVKEGECNTSEATVRDSGNHPVKKYSCINSTVNVSKLPVDLTKERDLKEPSKSDFVEYLHTRCSDRELPSEIRSFPPQPDNKKSSGNKNSTMTKMTDCTKGTPDPDNPNIITRKNFGKSAKSYDSGEGSSNLTWNGNSGKSHENERKKTRERKKTKGSTYRQMLRKKFRSIGRKYGKTYLVTPNSSPIATLKKYAEKHQVDFENLMKNADAMGLDLPFPCTECYFKKKTVDYYSSPIDMLSTLLDKQAVSMDKKCPDCGAERMTLGGYGKMIYNLRTVIEYRDLLVHDVYPDGNCMYAAIVDQLRTRGDFGWTFYRLREEAVEYLRKYPYEEDGTHKKMYLASETWEEYLERNSEDGEWGDHMMMSAIVEVLQRKIVILGGVSGMARTVIVPKSMHPAHTSKEGSEPTSDQPVDKKGELKKEQMEEEVEEKKKKEMRDDIGKEDKKEGEKKEEEDKEAKKKRMRDEALERKEKEDDELEDETCLYLGHLSEAHYISLRKRGWQKIVQEKLADQTQKMKQKLKEENPDLFLMGDEIDYSKAVVGKNEIDSMSKEPFLHLDFTVRQMLEGYFEITPMSYTPMDNEMYTFEFLGSKCDNLYPQKLIGGKTLMSRYAAEELLFCFPNSCENKEAEKINTLGEDVLFYCTPRDTRVHEKDWQDVATASDLIEEPVRNMSGTLYLCPKKSKIWRDRLAKNRDEKLCLQHILLQPTTVSLSTYHGDVFQASVRQIIAFKCQWPAEAAEWISRERPVNWPPAKVIEEIFNCGCHVIPVAYGEAIQGLEDYAMTWEYSFRVAEKSLALFHISKQQRTCFFIFRLLVEKQLQISPFFPYQVLKNIFLFACETFEDKIWSKQPGLCILHMLSKLVSYLEKGEAPMYFMPSKNLIKYVPRETTLSQAQQLEVLRFNPIISIYWLLDEYNFTSTDVGVALEDVLADLRRFSEHHSLKRSVYDVLLPASLEAAGDHIDSSEYGSAFQVIMDIYQELDDSDQLEEDFSVADFVKDNFSGLFIGYLWCLALCVDLNAGTNLVHDICLEYDCESVSFLFGPEIVEHLGDKPVPNLFARGWDLKFAKEMVIVLKSVKKYKAITVGLRYFLDTLEDFVVTEKSIPDSYYGHSSLFPRVSLYIELYNAYCKCNEVSEFADLLKRFEKIVFRLDNMEAYTCLSAISHKLGKEDISEIAAKKAIEKYQNGSYLTVCNCGECKLSLPLNDMDDEDDLFSELPPVKSATKKNKTGTISNERKGTARSRSHETSSMENPSVSSDGSSFEEPPSDIVSALSLLLGNTKTPSSVPTGHSGAPSVYALLFSPHVNSDGKDNSS